MRYEHSISTHKQPFARRCDIPISPPFGSLRSSPKEENSRTFENIEMRKKILQQFQFHSSSTNSESSSPPAIRRSFAFDEWDQPRQVTNFPLERSYQPPLNDNPLEENRQPRSSSGRLKHCGDDIQDEISCEDLDLQKPSASFESSNAPYLRIKLSTDAVVFSIPADNNQRSILESIDTSESSLSTIVELATDIFRAFYRCPSIQRRGQHELPIISYSSDHGNSTFPNNKRPEGGNLAKWRGDENIEGCLQLPCPSYLPVDNTKTNDFDGIPSVIYIRRPSRPLRWHQKLARSWSRLMNKSKTHRRRGKF